MHRVLYPDRDEATSLQFPGLRLRDVRQPVSHSRAGAGFVVSAGESVSCAWEAFQKSVNHALLAHLLFFCPFPKSPPCDFQENPTPVPSVPTFPNTRCSEANRFSCSAFPSKFCPGYPTPLPCQQPLVRSRHRVFCMKCHCISEDAGPQCSVGSGSSSLGHACLSEGSGDAVFRSVGDTGQHTLVLFRVYLVSCHAKIFSRCSDFPFPHTAHESSPGSPIVRISLDSHSHLLLSFFFG